MGMGFPVAKTNRHVKWILAFPDHRLTEWLYVSGQPAFLPKGAEYKCVSHAGAGGNRPRSPKRPAGPGVELHRQIYIGQYVSTLFLLLLR
jgi:hypothetical protein